MGQPADGGVLPPGRPGARAEYGHKSDVRSSQRHDREVAGRLHRLHRPSAVGDVGRPRPSGRPGHPGHPRGESRLVPIGDTTVTALGRSAEQRTTVRQDTLSGNRPDKYTTCNSVEPATKKLLGAFHNHKELLYLTKNRTFHKCLDLFESVFKSKSVERAVNNKWLGPAGFTFCNLLKTRHFSNICAYQNL